MEEPRKKRIKTVLSVSRKELITPQYLRIFLTGSDVPLFANATTGDNNKTLFPPEGVQVVHFPEFNPETKRWKPQPENIRPTIRTLTHRGINLKNNEIWIDFVLHDNVGVASNWAKNAKSGDVLGIMMKQYKEPLYPPVDNYLLIGDAAAIPVLSAILESLPSSANATCLLEVPNSFEERFIKTRSNVRFYWLHNKHPEKGSRLAEVLRQQTLPEESRYAYIAAEYRTVKAIRKFLKKEKGWKSSEFYAYSYWKAGQAENESERDRKKEKKETE